MKRGFSAYTAILVALLIGILFWVGKVVNPPVKGGHDDHDHESASAAPSAPAQKSPPAQKEPPTTLPKATMQSPSLESQKMAQMKREHTPPLQAKGNSAPKSDGMDASYWQENSMGAVKPKPTPSAQ